MIRYIKLAECIGVTQTTWNHVGMQDHKGQTCALLAWCKTGARNSDLKSSSKPDSGAAWRHIHYVLEDSWHVTTDIRAKRSN
ncbi:hypothetical protein TNCV_4979121 [Trichonephila clavipes]|nr:hypothetical protein TNCV_4979121 [Trichonephila clavipes]